MLTILQLSIYSVFILIFILISLKREHHSHDIKVRVFRYMILLVLICLLLDILFISLERTSYFFTRPILVYGNAIQYALTCLTVFMWYLYNEQFIFNDLSHFRKWIKFTSIPLMINLSLSLLSPWFGFFYTITSDNVYVRGSLFLTSAITTYFYAVLTAFLIHIHRNKMRRTDYLPLMFFILPPAFGGIMQMMNYGILLIGPSLTFSFLVAFVYIQSKNMELDFLTGLYTRKELENYADILSKQKNIKKYLGGMMIDIDDFKKINDDHGHDVGDKVLREISDVFKRSFRNSDFVSRVGGDEFVAVCEVQSLMDLEVIVTRIRGHLDNINSLSHYPFEICLSIGYDLWDTKNFSKDEFMIHIDKKMYLEKDAKKLILS
ncbi:MAG: hypothetical protein CVU85_08485 [Firmicutes bacterium HGW-Firmicutes-10]|nr:MAG: hypothetical protein CVU85_08485 [Firmicutes bacterium HGW-Firmicutes-10]